MPWKIKCLIGERKRFVKLALAAQQPLAQLCRSFGISRSVAYKWIGRFCQDGARGLRDRPRAPQHSPRRTKERWLKAIRQVRRRRPYWGAKKIQAMLRRRWRNGVPAVRTIGKWLRRMKLTQPMRRRSPKGPLVLRSALRVPQRANQVWTADFKGWFRTANKVRVEPLTVRDLYSRFVLEIRLLSDQRWELVQRAFRRVFRRYGLPHTIRVDNGGPFASTGPGGLSRLSAWWTALGVRVEFTRPGHPEDNGAHEQFHRVLKTETTKPPSTTMRAQQRRIARWIKVYNCFRAHEALGQRTPAEFYRQGRRCYQPVGEMSYPKRWAIRRVRSNGQIKWQGRLRSIGEALVGQRVGLKVIGGGWEVYFGPVLLGELRPSDPFGLRPTASARTDRRVIQKTKV